MNKCIVLITGSVIVDEEPASAHQTLKHQLHRQPPLNLHASAAELIVRVNGAHLFNASQLIRTIIIATARGTSAVAGPRTGRGRRRRRRRSRPTGATLAAVASQVIRAIIITAARGTGTVAGPGAGRLRAGGLGGGGRRGRSRATSAANTGNELVTKRAQRGLKGTEGAGSPVGTVGTGNGIITGEGNVQNVVRVVGSVAVDSVAVTGTAESVGDLTDQGRTVITVGVTPDAVELMAVLVLTCF